MLAMMLTTFLLRFGPIAIFSKIKLPMWSQHLFRLVVPAIFMALVLPVLVLQNGTLFLSPSNPRLIAGLVAVGVSWRTHNMVLTIFAGMATLWLLMWLGWGYR